MNSDSNIPELTAAGGVFFDPEVMERLTGRNIEYQRIQIEGVRQVVLRAGDVRDMSRNANVPDEFLMYAYRLEPGSRVDVVVYNGVSSNENERVGDFNFRGSVNRQETLFGIVDGQLQSVSMDILVDPSRGTPVDDFDPENPHLNDREALLSVVDEIRASFEARKKEAAARSIVEAPQHPGRRERM